MTTIVNLFDPSQVSQLINEIQNTGTRTRTEDEFRGYELLNGKISEHVKDDLKKKRPLTHSYYRVSAVNILKKINNKIAKSYKSGVKRTVSIPEGSEQVNQAVNDNYRIIMESGHFDWSMQGFDKIFTNHMCGLVWLQNDNVDKKKFYLKPLAPYVFYVVIDDYTGELRCVVLSYPDTATTQAYATDPYSDGLNQAIAESSRDSSGPVRTYAMWTDTQQINVVVKQVQIEGAVETRITYVQDPNNPNGVNPLGELPFIWASVEMDSPEMPQINPLFEETININSMNSELLTGACISAVGIMKIKFPQGQEFSDYAIGHNVALKLPQSVDPDAPETDAEFISSSPPIDSIKSVIKEYTEAIISDRGIANFSLTGDSQKFSSGFDRALAMADVTEVREENQKIYTYIEKKIFDKIKKFDLINGTQMFTPDCEVNIEFPKPKILATDKEELEVIKMKKDLGALEDYEVIMEIRKDLSEEQARDKVKQANKAKQENMNLLINGMSKNPAEGIDDGDTQK